MADFSEYLEYLVTSKPLMNGGACAAFIVIMLESIFRMRISFGSIPPKIRKSENPRAFWSIISLYGVFAVWFGLKAALAIF
jgi:hypothetical protein